MQNERNEVKGVCGIWKSLVVLIRVKRGLGWG